MKKNMLWFWLVTAALCAAAIAALLLWKKQPETPPDPPAEAPLSASYQWNGGMINESESISYSWNDGKAEIVYVHRLNGKEKTVTKKVDEKCAAALKELFDFYGIAGWKAEKPEEYALDAGSTRISFFFADGRSYSFSDEDVLPEGAGDAIRSLRLCLMEFAGLEQK